MQKTKYYVIPLNHICGEGNGWGDNTPVRFNPGLCIGQGQGAGRGNHTTGIDGVGYGEGKSYGRGKDGSGSGVY